MKPVVDAAWLEERARRRTICSWRDVRGPNAHTRGHLPGSNPLVLGSPPPMSDRATVEALAAEVGLRLRRHGVTGAERLVLYDRGDGVGAMPAAQVAELGGHPRVAVLARRDRRLDGRAGDRRVELEKVRVELGAEPPRRCRPARSSRRASRIRR